MSELRPCPYCGSPATVIHMVDTYDGADFGWDVGCPKWSLYDKHHDHIMPKPRIGGLMSKKEAIEAWNEFCENRSDGNG